MTELEKEQKAKTQSALGVLYFNLGMVYYYGLDGEQCYTEAAKWFTKAAEKGDVRAQYTLGWMYEIGGGVKQDYAEGIRWYTEAAEQGDTDAQNRLDFLYYGGHGGVPYDAESIAWRKKAVENLLDRIQFMAIKSTKEMENKND